MAELIRISEYARRTWGENGTPPRTITIRRWLIDGRLPGRQIGRTWYVDWSAMQRMTGDDLVDKVLQTK